MTAAGMTVFVLTSWADHEGESSMGVFRDLETAQKAAKAEFDMLYPPGNERGHSMTDWTPDAEGNAWEAGVATPYDLFGPSHGYMIRQETVQ